MGVATGSGAHSKFKKRSFVNWYDYSILFALNMADASRTLN